MSKDKRAEKKAIDRAWIEARKEKRLTEHRKAMKKYYNKKDMEKDSKER